MAFKVVLQAKSILAFTFFEEQYLGFEQNDQINENFTKLLDIEPNKTVYYLLSMNNKTDEKKKIINKLIQKIKKEQQEQEISPDE